MNAQQLEGQWNEIRGELRRKWGQLTDQDLEIQNGNIDQLVGRIQQKTGEGREAIENYLENLTSQTATAVGQAADTARDYAQQAMGKIRDNYETAAGQARRTYDEAENYVRERPAQSVAAAFAAGVLIGLVVGLSLRSR